MKKNIFFSLLLVLSSLSLQCMDMTPAEIEAYRQSDWGQEDAREASAPSDYDRIRNMMASISEQILPLEYNPEIDYSIRAISGELNHAIKVSFPSSSVGYRYKARFNLNQRVIALENIQQDYQAFIDSLPIRETMQQRDIYEAYAPIRRTQHAIENLKDVAAEMTKIKRDVLEDTLRDAAESRRKVRRSLLPSIERADQQE